MVKRMPRAIQEQEVDELYAVTLGLPPQAFQELCHDSIELEEILWTSRKEGITIAFRNGKAFVQRPRRSGTMTTDVYRDGGLENRWLRAQILTPTDFCRF